MDFEEIKVNRFYAFIKGCGEKEMQDVLYPYGVPMALHPKGQFVLYEDYEKLFNERLNWINSGQAESINELKTEISKLEEHNAALCERIQDLNSEIHTASCHNANLHKEKARLEAEIESVRKVASDNKIETESTRLKIAKLNDEIKQLKALDSLKTISLTDSTNWNTIGAYAEAMEENEQLKADAKLVVKHLDDSCKETSRLKMEMERLEKEVWRMKMFNGINEDTIKGLKAALKTAPEWEKVLEAIENNARLEAENRELKAEGQRLRNLGCDIANEFVRTEFTSSCSYGDPPCEPPPEFSDYPLSVQIWFNHIHAAKDGKPSV